MAFVLLGIEGIVLVIWQIHAGANPWTIAFAPTPFDHPLAVCRGGLLLATVWALLALGPRRRLGVGLLVVAVFSSSALALALYVPAFLLATATVGACYPRDAAAQRRGRIAGWSLLAVTAALLAPPRRDPPLPVLAPQRAAAWLERDNPFRAHWEAANWSALERANGTLGAGTLLRAELEHRLGKTAKALDTLAAVRSTNADPETQRRAAILFAAWAKEGGFRVNPPLPAATPATP
ncbi:hypothetical protein KF840_09955 [bacterium]|nr:hypothetical protein [bacterium]